MEETKEDESFEQAQDGNTNRSIEENDEEEQVIPNMLKNLSPRSK